MLIGTVNQSQPTAQGKVPKMVENNNNTAQQLAETGVDDVVEISTEGKQKARVDKDGKVDIATLLAQLENARAQGEAMGDMITERIKCLQIAMRIMAGDKVPLEDVQFLAEKDPDLYARSIMMRKENDDPKEWERLSEDEEDERGKEEKSTGTGAVKAGGGEATATQPAVEENAE